MEVLDGLEDSFEQALCEKADLLHFPLGATFELSPLCNFRCRMCYIEQKNKDVERAGGLKTVEFWLGIARQAVKEGNLYVLLTGGETLLYPGFKELYLGLKKLGMYVVINTNGSLLTKEMVHFLGENPPKRINVSLYGACEDTYEKLCGNRKAFTQVLENLTYLKEYNEQAAKAKENRGWSGENAGVPVRIHTVLTPDNYDDYEGIVEMCNELKMPLQFFMYIFPSVRKGNPSVNKEARLDSCKAGCAKYRYLNDVNYHRMEDYLDAVMYEMEHYEEYPYYGCRSVACRGGVSTYWVNWKGEMCSCGQMDYPVISLETHSFKECWEYIRSEVDRFRINEECASCKKRRFCPICVAAAYAETGDIAGKPKYLCDMTEQYLSLAKNKYQEIQNDENEV